MEIKRYTPEKKAQINREIILEHKSVSHVAIEFNSTPATIYKWQKTLMEKAVDLF